MKVIWSSLNSTPKDRKVIRSTNESRQQKTSEVCPTNTDIEKIFEGVGFFLKNFLRNVAGSYERTYRGYYFWLSVPYSFTKYLSFSTLSVIC